MEKRIIAYRKYINNMLESDCDRDWECEINMHLVQIGFFQHERLVHLIVTVTFAILLMLSVMTTLLAFNIFLVLLDVIIAMLLVPYIRHYYILENEVQKMYAQYDKMMGKIHS